MRLRIRRDKWLRGQASMLMLGDGRGCVIGHYLVAKRIPREKLLYRYGFGEQLKPFERKMAELGEFVPDEGSWYFSTTPEAEEIIGVNDGDPRHIYDQHVAPVDNDEQREAVLIRLMAEIGCQLEFV